MPQLRHIRQARPDFTDIWLSIAADNPAAADRMLDRIENRTQKLSQWPKAGLPWPALALDARMLVERPYLILYRATIEGTQIVRVLHGAREIEASLFAEGVE